MLAAVSTLPLAAPIRAAPLAPDERITPIDMLRGIALFGVLMVNLTKEFRVSLFAQFLPSDAASPGDRWLEAFISSGFEMKAFALFSLLFGIGLAIQRERLAQRARAQYWLARRLVVLLVFGLVHLLLIWNGDILTEYALAGLVVLPLLRCGNRTLAIAAFGLLAFYVLMPLLNLPIYWPDQTTLAGMVEAANHIYAYGTLSQIVRFSFGELRVILPLHLFVFPRTLGLFLLGALLWRSGVPGNLRRYRTALLYFGLASLAAGLTLTLALAANDFANDPRLAACLSNLAPILQALIFGWTFFGYGLGRFATMSVTMACVLGVSVYVLQMIGSMLWLRRYRFGPLEWLWRTLMYGKFQPMLRSGA